MINRTHAFLLLLLLLPLRLFGQSVEAISIPNLPSFGSGMGVSTNDRMIIYDISAPTGTKTRNASMNQIAIMMQALGVGSTTNSISAVLVTQIVNQAIIDSNLVSWTTSSNLAYFVANQQLIASNLTFYQQGSNAAYALRSLLVFTNQQPAYSVTNGNRITYIIPTNGGGSSSLTNANDLLIQVLTNNGLKTLSAGVGITLTDQGTNILFEGSTNSGVTAATATNIAGAVAQPLANAAVTNSTLVLVLGDSKSDDIGIPGYLNWTSELFPFASFSNKVSLINLSVSGTTLQTQLANSTNRLKPFIQANTNRQVVVIVALGVNDEEAGRTLTQMTNDLVQINLAAKSWGALQVIPYTFGGTGLVSMTLKTNFQIAVSNLVVAGVFNNFVSEWVADGNLLDSKHPSATGAWLVASNANVRLSTNFPAVLANSLPQTYLGRVRVVAPQIADTSFEWGGNAVGQNLYLHEGPNKIFEASQFGLGFSVDTYVENKSISLRDSGQSTRMTLTLSGTAPYISAPAGFTFFTSDLITPSLQIGDQFINVGTNFSVSYLGFAMPVPIYQEPTARYIYRDLSSNDVYVVRFDRGGEFGVGATNAWVARGLYDTNWFGFAANGTGLLDLIISNNAVRVRGTFYAGGNSSFGTNVGMQQLNASSGVFTGALNNTVHGPAIRVEGGASPAIQAYDSIVGQWTNLFISGKKVTLASEGNAVAVVTNGQFQFKSLPPTNGTPSIMATINPTTGAIESSAVPAGGSVTTNYNTIAAGSATIGSLIVTNDFNVGNLVATNLAITYTTVNVSVATNLALNFNLTAQEINLTNSATFTNVVLTTGSTNLGRLSLYITPQGGNQTVTWPTGTQFGVKVKPLTTMWTTLTNGRSYVVAMDLIGTNLYSAIVVDQ